MATKIGGKAMNLINEEISHQTFGAGKVTDQTPTIITVEFSEEYGVKRFKYPSVFESFLTPVNPETKESMALELKGIKDKEDAEKKALQDAQVAAKEEEQKAAAEKKKSSSKKRAPSTKPKAKPKAKETAKKGAAES
jgi:hypothetical protein